MKIAPVATSPSLLRLPLLQNLANRWNQNRDEILLECAAAASVLVFGITFFAGKIFVSLCALAIGSICHYVANNLEKFQQFQNVVSNLRVEAKRHADQNVIHQEHNRRQEETRKQLETQVVSLKGEVSVLSSENTKLKTHVHGLASTTKQLSSITDSAKGHAETLKTQNTRLEGSIGTLQLSHGQLSEQLSSLRSIHQSACQELDSLRQTYEHTASQLLTLQQANKDLKGSLSELDGHHRQMKVAFVNVKQENEALNKANAELSLHLASLQGSTTKLQELLILCKLNVKTLNNQLKPLATTSKELTLVQQGLKGLHEKFTSAHAEVSVQMIAAQQLCESVADQFRQGLAQLQEGLRDLKADGSTIEKLRTLQELQTQVRQAHGRLQKMKAQEKDIIARLEQLRKEYEEMLSRYREERQKFAAENEILKTTHGSLRHEVDKFTKGLQTKVTHGSTNTSSS